MKLTKDELIEMHILIVSRMSQISEFPKEQQEESFYKEQLSLISSVLEKIRKELKKGRKI